MELFGRPTIAEDSVQYQLFLTAAEPTEPEERRNILQQYVERILARFAPLLVQYIWQYQPFNINYVPDKEDVPAHIGGSTNFGDNVEDEWFIVYLVQEITKEFPKLVAKIEDNDGEFLLIEAAEYLPKWLNPESSNNRVFIFQGELHIIPVPKTEDERLWLSEGNPSILQALKIIGSNSEECLAAETIRSSVARRIAGYPQKIQSNFHHAHCYLPAGIVSVLKIRPDLVASAVTAFYLRDPIDLQACRTFRFFTPETRVMAVVTFTKCLYAQLQQQRFIPDKRSGYMLPPRSHPKFKAHELGMKLGELEGSAKFQELIRKAEVFFQQFISKPHNVLSPGEEILQLLERNPYNIEEMRTNQSHLPAEDSDSWLEISPEELDRLLEQASRSSAQRPVVQAGLEDDELAEAYSLSAIPQSMKAFINKMSTHEGAEVPWSSTNEQIKLDGNSMANAIKQILGFSSRGEDELDSDDFEDEDDEDDLLDSDSDGGADLGPVNMDGNAVGNLKVYMDEMDRELAGTNIAKSFTTHTTAAGASVDIDEDSRNIDDKDQQTNDEAVPLDLDLNLVSNLLESLSSQAGRCRTVPLNEPQQEDQHADPYRQSNGLVKNQHGLKNASISVSHGGTSENNSTFLVPCAPQRPVIRQGHITAQQVYNFLNAEAGEPALHNPDYMLILDCRSAERYKQSHMVTARVSLTVLHPELGCLITRGQLQEYSIILLYGENFDGTDSSRDSSVDSATLQRCFCQLSSLGMDPIILLGGYSTFAHLYPFLCTHKMILLESERQALTIYPSEILEGSLYQGSAHQASDYRIIKNLHITHVLNATGECPDAFPATLCYLKLRLNDDTHQDVFESFPVANKFISQALQVDGGRVLVHCSLGRSRSSALTLAFLMEHQRWTLRHAYEWLKERRACAAPNAGFLRQLSSYEERLFGKKLTALDDLCV
ncbi:ECD protein, partial [Polypterus senegalus]